MQKSGTLKSCSTSSTPHLAVNGWHHWKVEDMGRSLVGMVATPLSASSFIQFGPSYSVCCQQHSGGDLCSERLCLGTSPSHAMDSSSPGKCSHRTLLTVDESIYGASSWKHPQEPLHHTKVHHLRMIHQWRERKMNRARGFYLPSVKAAFTGCLTPWHFYLSLVGVGDLKEVLQRHPQEGPTVGGEHPCIYLKQGTRELYL